MLFREEQEAALVDISPQMLDLHILRDGWTKLEIAAVIR